MKLKFEIALGLIKDSYSGSPRKMFRESNPKRVIYLHDNKLYEKTPNYFNYFTATNEDMFADDWLVTDENLVCTQPSDHIRLEEAVEVDLKPYISISEEDTMKYGVYAYKWSPESLIPSILLC